MPDPQERRLTLMPMVRRTAPALDDAGVVARILGAVIGPVNVDIRPATSAVVTSVAASVVTVTLLAANLGAIPRQASFYNDSPARVIFLKLGAGASTVSFTVRLMPRAFYEITDPGFDGIVTGVWSAGAGGFCRVTELT
jgi:hypothetical protein